MPLTKPQGPPYDMLVVGVLDGGSTLIEAGFADQIPVKAP